MPGYVKTREEIARIEKFLKPARFTCDKVGIDFTTSWEFAREVLPPIFEPIAPPTTAAETKLRRCSFELLTRSSATLALILPAWTSTRATPDKALWGTSTRVSTATVSLHNAKKLRDHR